eukprot:g1931.t1
MYHNGHSVKLEAATGAEETEWARYHNNLGAPPPPRYAGGVYPQTGGGGGGGATFQDLKGGEVRKLKTSKVEKYAIGTQVSNIGDGTMNGWWVVGYTADGGGSTGPGKITLSERRPSFEDLRGTGTGTGTGMSTAAKAASPRALMPSAPPQNYDLVGTSNIGKYQIGQEVQIGTVSGFICRIEANTPGASSGPGKLFIGLFPP